MSFIFNRLRNDLNCLKFTLIWNVDSTRQCYFDVTLPEDYFHLEFSMAENFWSKIPARQD